MRKFIVGAAVLVVSLAGCVGPEVGGMPVPTATPTPVFASDEEALAAAESAYGAYLAELDLALSTLDAAGLADVASGRALSEAIESVEGFRTDEHHLSGHSTYDSASLIHVEADGHVGIHVCLDISNTDVLDRNGSSVVAAGRPARLPMQVTAHLSPEMAALIVSEAEVWGGANFCG